MRWTDEERTNIECINDVIGQSNLKHFGTLILNNGHDFKAKYPDNTTDKFKQYLRDQASRVPELEKFLSLFVDRVIILDTELEDEELNNPQLDQFYNGLKDLTFKIDKKTQQWPFCCFT